MKQKIGILALGLLLTSAPVWAQTYQIDPAHTAVTFKVAHMVVSKVIGRFEKFEGTVDYDKEKPGEWNAQAKIDANSINTNVADRDKHLRSADFLDIEKFPQITFTGSKVSEVKGNKAKLTGELAIHGTTRTVVLDLEIGGVVKDPWGNQRLGASATTKINRKDFGLTWNKLLEAGGVLVGEEVEITLDVEAVAKKS